MLKYILWKCFQKDSINSHRAHLKKKKKDKFWPVLHTSSDTSPINSAIAGILEHPLVRRAAQELRASVEGGVRVLDDAAPAVAPDEPQSLRRNLAVLHVEKLQLAAVGRQSFESSACYALAGSEADSPQALAVHGQLLQTAVRH